MTEQPDYIEQLWQSAKEGLITWDEACDLQAAYLRELAPVPLPTAEEIRAQQKESTHAHPH